MEKQKPTRPTLAELEAALQSEKQRKRPTLAELEQALAEEKRIKEQKKHKVKPAKKNKPKSDKPVKAKEPKSDKPVKAKEPKPDKPIKAKEPKPEKPVKAKEPKPDKPIKAKESKPEKPVKTVRPSSEQRPDAQALEQALEKRQRRHSFFRLLRNTVFVLITVAAIAALVATLFMPVMKVYSGSMAPGMLEGDIVVSLKEKNVSDGDVIAFYYNNKLFIKRVIAGPGEVVNIDEEGNVFVNDVLLDEPYVNEKSRGITDVTYPYLVPEHYYFVLGDSRVNSSDSRSSAMGCVSQDDILGRVLFRVWPLNHISLIH